jgi:hypothetical protein
MTISSYAIGLTYAGLVNVETVVSKPPRGRFFEWTTENKRGDGLYSVHGPKSAEWRFSYITATERDALRAAYCPTGKSANIFITTRMPNETFATFYGVLVWPSRDDELRAMSPAGPRVDFVLTFENLRPYTWWLEGGIDPASILGAYRAIGAASKAASLVNLNDPGVNDLTESGTVTFSAAAGWSGFSAANYLQSAFAPDDNRGIVVRFSDATAVINTTGLAGVSVTTNTLALNVRSLDRRYSRGNTAITSFGSGSATAGTVGIIRSSNSSRHRVWQSTSFTAVTDNNAITSAINMPLGRTVDDTGAHYEYFAGKILAAVFLGAAITDDQSYSLITAMNNLTA